ncbi:MAG TPA: peptidase M61 [Rhodanobacteraceae bacterium]|nr:peptidase M61 [Rhodanobacteraceae bacterium]
MNSIPGAAACVLLFAMAVAGAEEPAPADVDYPGTLRLAVDATDIDHRVFRVREEVPVGAGALTLLYPQWLPGNHGPRGPIDKLAALAFTVDGKPLAWSRDSTDVYAFHVDVPSGATTLVAEFAYLSPQDSGQGRVVMTPDMLNLQWNTVVLYPAGHFSSRINVAPSVKLPAGWQFGTALDEAGGNKDSGAVAFKPVTLETLVDSPIFAGRYFKRVDLDPGARVPVRMDIVADEAKDLEITPEQLKPHRALVQQAYKLFGSHHYDHYDFLLALSDLQTHIGLEHHRSSEDGTEPAYFIGWDRLAHERDLLPHEFTHSWNGKFRRPADLATPNYNVPMGDSLLWVYEGQTQYWGFVLAARSGLLTADQARDAWALIASRYTDNRPGFSWRNVQDTTNDPVAAQRRPQPYRNYQLSEDYYSAGQMIWLAVDAKLRDLTHGRRSLDDFAHAFFGVDDGSWKVKTYTFADVAAALNAIEPYDWSAFLRQRLDAHAPPLDGFAASGWKLVYNDKPSAYQKAAETEGKYADHAASIGIAVSTRDNKIADVRWNGPAFKAGISPGGTLVAVQGREFTPDRLKDAIAATSGGTPLELLIKDAEIYRTYRVDYRDGLKYPHLERIAGSADHLSAILAPRK